MSSLQPLSRCHAEGAQVVVRKARSGAVSVEISATRLWYERIEDHGGRGRRRMNHPSVLAMNAEAEEEERDDEADTGEGARKRRSVPRLFGEHTADDDAIDLLWALERGWEFTASVGEVGAEINGTGEVRFMIFFVLSPQLNTLQF